ncbi:MAG: WxL protein peptidoglycan domain-containing protein [Acidimicrobiia bacterium]
MTHTTRLALAVLMFATAVTTGGGTAAAQEAPPPPGDQTAPDEPVPDGADRPSWSVRPAGDQGQSERTHFVYTLPPGARLVDTVAVTNVDPEPLTVAIYSADAYNTSQDGAFALRLPEEPKIGVASWIRLGVQEHTIPPETTIEIPFELTVPEDAEPGDHAGALLAANVDLEEGGGSPEIDVQLRRRVGTRIYVRVEGPIEPALSLTELAVDDHHAVVPFITGRGGTDVRFTVSNNGNVRLTPDARIELVGPFGTVVGKADEQTLPELLPGGSVEREAEIDGLPPLGKLSVRVVVTADETETRASRTVWAMPWVYLALVLLLLARWQWRRWRRRRAERNALAGSGSPAHAETEEQLTA